jgi:sugar phosphate isomerase/epimerase
MQREFMLAYFTTAPLAPAEAVLIAHKVGYCAIGIRLAALSDGGDFSSLCENPVLVRETTARMKETGVSIFDVEGVRLEEGFRVGHYDRLLAVAAELGAKVLSVISYDPDEQRRTDSFAKLCDAATEYKLTAALEFIPYSTIPDLHSALRMLHQVQRPNARIIVDFLHAVWSKMTRADLDAIPKGQLSHAQLCDVAAEKPATREGLIHVARYARPLPGEGAIDIRMKVEELPNNVPISIEVPNVEQLALHGAEEWARRALLATRRALKK